MNSHIHARTIRNTAVSATIFVWGLGVAASGQEINQPASLNSQLFMFKGWCTGGDMVYRWGIDGKPAGSGSPPAPTEYGRAFIYPWLDFDIMIRGIEITIPGSEWRSLLFEPARFRYLMVGNNASGDLMASLPPGSQHVMNWFPSGTSFVFPSKMSMTPLTYLDLHGTCPMSEEARVFLNIYYTAVLKTPSP